MLSGKKLVCLSIQILYYSWMDTASWLFLIRCLYMLWCIISISQIVCKEYNCVDPNIIPIF